MNCRDFLNEFEERNALGKTATLHLRDCADCQKINGVQTRVWQIIDGFEPVAAPNDFNFRVKARIANSKPRDFQQSFLPVLRYVLPLSVVGLILAFVVFNGIYSLDDKTVPQVAEKNFQTPIQKKNPAAEPSPFEQIASTTVPQIVNDKSSVVEGEKRKTAQIENKKRVKNSQDETLLAAVKSTKKPQVKDLKEVGKTSGGSIDTTLRSAHSILPKGFPNPSQANKNPSNFPLSSSITAEQILLQLGIESALENGQQKVKKVSANSVGEHSGVKVGDVVEAIDGEKLTSEPIRAKTIEGKKLTVKRGAEKVEISLHN